MLVTGLQRCMWGRGREGAMALALLSAEFVTPFTTHNQIGPFWCWFQSGWARACSRPLWVSPMHSPVRLGVSPTAASIPTGVFNQWFEALFPHAGALGCSLFRSPTVPPGLSMCKCGDAGSDSHHLVGSASCSLACPIPQSATSLSPPAAALLRVLSAQLPISAPPTGLGECFFFISLVVGLPFSLIFCQLWLFFVFKLLLSFFWLCKEAQCVYLCLHLGQKLPSHL